MSAELRRDHSALQYDLDADAVYIAVHPELSVVRQLEVTPDIIVDQDDQGATVGVEVLHPSANLSYARRWLAAHGGPL